MSLAKQLLGATSLYGPAKRIYQKLTRRPRHPLQDLSIVPNSKLVRLGSEYGGWSFIDDESLHGCTIISAGLGEDASFDIEFARKYRATVIIVDPTPRALIHFNKIISRLGRENESEYVSGGDQPVEAYNLSNLKVGNFAFVEKALWNEPAKLRFFEPPNPDHVSHSVVNYQNRYSEDTPSIEVQATSLPGLFADLKIDPEEVPLIKLDIEGAEIEVLIHCMSIGFSPKQILVEFDELTVPSPRGFERVSNAHTLLVQNGYQLEARDGVADFLYVKRVGAPPDPPSPRHLRQL